MSKVIELINSREFTSIKDKILPLLKSSIRVRTISVPEEKIEIGTSKIGGSPDLPRDLDWPECNRLPLSFIAQFNLSELSTYNEDNTLPSSGMLYIFYDTIRVIIHDYDENYNEVSKIFYYNGDLSQLTRTPPPKQLVNIRGDLWDAGIFRACAITFAKEKVLPESDSLYISDLGLNDNEKELYIRLIGEISKLYNKKEDKMRRLPTYITHRLLGYSDGINGSYMEYDCQLRLEGISWKEIFKGAFTKLDESQKLKIKKECINWRLLFQIDSDYKAQTEWGDVGRIYFWIRNEALKKKDFSLIYALYQG
ncbi:MAG: YwqG family protein [Promethearchaeota archaeon]